MTDATAIRLHTAEIPAEVAAEGEGMSMAAPTGTLHETLIRLAKGMIIAWEKWLQEQS